MWHGLKIGAAMVVVVGLVMSALAVARAADEPASDGQRIGAEQLILEALAPLLDDGTLTGEQAEAVIDELAPLVALARFRAGTHQMLGQLGRLTAETAEVLGITAADLRQQTESGSTLAEIAAANGSSGEQLVGAVTEHIAAHLAVQVTAGNLDQRRAAEIVARTSETLGNLVDVEHPFGTLLQERRNRALRRAALWGAADALGMSVEEVRTTLEDGISLAEMADAQGVAEDDLIDALLTPVVERIEQALDRGRLTAEAAAEALEKATRRAKEAIGRIPGT